MKIDIYSHTRNRFVAVPHKHVIPESWDGAKYFKTIDLKSGDVRIGMGDAALVLKTIEVEGYAAI